MKDKRNCGPYPIYPNPGMQMPYQVPMQAPMYPAYQQGMTSPIEERLNNMESQINMLNERVNRLENLNQTNTTNYNKYNDSNYYMV